MTVARALDFAYIALVVLCSVDLMFIGASAMKAATGPKTRGRLLATSLVLVGLIVGASGRVANSVPAVLAGVLLIIGGLLLYTWFLPTHRWDGGDDPKGGRG